MNWSKEKIVKMAEVTGLSQSQVYKWCWDQKKKTSKYFRERDDELAHRKLIRKDYRERQPGQEEDMKWRHVETKVKPRGDLDTEVESTSKKINKKLLF